MNPQPLHLMNYNCLQIIFYFLDRSSTIFLSHSHPLLYNNIYSFFNINSNIIQKNSNTIYTVKKKD